MGGGLILMGVLLLFFPVEQAMIVHGVTQFIANGSRAYFLKESIRWDVIPKYFLGIIPVLVLFYSLHYVPSKGVVYLLLGLFPFISLILRRLNLFHLNIEKSFYAFLCGVLVTIVQLTAGASGVVLTEFYIHSQLDRKEIVGTESFTQSTAHVTKFLYYLFILGWDRATDILPVYYYILIIVLSVWGTYLGKVVLLKMSDKYFKKYSAIIIRVLALFFVYKGLKELGPWF